MVLQYNECVNMIFPFSLFWKPVNKNNYNDNVGTLQCDHFDIGTVQYGNSNNLPFYQPWKQVSALARALDCGMFCVEYNSRAYNVVCSMIHLGYVPSILPVHRVPVVDPVFDITIVNPRSVLQLVKLVKKNHLCCIQKKNPYALCPFRFSTFFVTMTILMVRNNQVQVCDDVIPMIVDGIHNIDGDGDYALFHPILNPNSLDCGNDRKLAYANCFEDYNWINANQSSNIISPPSLSQKEIHQSSNITSPLSLP